MREKRYSIVLSIIVISLLLCHGSFAQDIEIHPDLTRDPTLSQQALGLAKQQFTQLKDQLLAMKPKLPADQQVLVDEGIAKVEDTLNRLGRIEVYFTDTTYGIIRNFYAARLSLQEVANNDVQDAITEVPPDMIPAETLDSLNVLLEQGKIKGATGKAGKSRISILTAYVNPETFEVIERTTVVIAIDK